MFIPLSLALLALASGMFLLAKTNKDGLGLFFKSVSIFIIAVSVLVMGLVIIGGFTGMIFHRAQANAWMSERRENGHREFFRHRHHHQKKHHTRKDDDQPGEERWGREGDRMRDERREEFRMENHDMPANMMDERLERSSSSFSEQLSLKPEQVQQLREILRTSMQKEAGIRANSNGDMEQFKKLSKENHQAKMDAIKKILTPEQLKLFNEREHARQAGHSQD